MSRWLDRLRIALRTGIRRRRVEDELDEELQSHLEREIDDRVSRGVPPDEARYAAMRAMGAIEKSKEECRDLRTGSLVADFLSDLRYAGRALARSPAFTVLAIGIMTLGIGANTAVFSVVNGVLLKPLPYPGADRIVTVTTRNVVTGEINPLVNLLNFRDWRDQSASFEAIATYRFGEAPVTPGDTAEYGQQANVDGPFFRVLAVEPVLGRTFSAEETVPGSDRPAALISHSYWQSRFGGAPDILQRTIRIGNTQRPIVGVMPPGFHFPRRTDVWTNQTTRTTSRTAHGFLAVARLEAGVSLDQAQTELTGIAARLEQQYPESNKGRGVGMMRLQDVLVGDVRLTLYLLWGVVGVVLLIACANTATLLLGKATARTREMAVRTALGASRGRLVRLLITESLLLALVAGYLGMVLAYWGARALIALTPSDVVRLADPGIDRGVLTFTVAVSLATSVLFGLVPALHASRVDLIEALKQGGSGAGTGARMVRTRGMLVVAEIALAVVLLTGAGLLVKSLLALHGADLGFQPSNVLVMKATGSRTLQENNTFYRETMSRIAGLPGVVAVGATANPPGDLSNSGNGSYFIDRMPEKRDRATDPFAYYNFVAPGTFGALGIPLKIGRDFNEGDTGDSPLVAIVNEALVRRSIPGENPIGRTIICNFDRKGAMTIVGVVGDVRQRNPAIAPMPECYMPHTQHEYNNRTLNIVTRTAGDPMALAATVRRLAADVSPDVPVSFTTMEETVSKRVEDPRFRALLFGLFAALAVCLAMAGVYGVITYGVQQRSKEIGLRMALGSSRGAVLRLILRQGLVLAAAGLTIGLGVAIAASRLLTTMLFEVQPVDAQVYVGVALLLGAVTLLAGYLPARRAAAMDPMAVLKTD
jgi:predicted permease